MNAESLDRAECTAALLQSDLNVVHVGGHDVRLAGAFHVEASVSIEISRECLVRATGDGSASNS